MTALHQFGAEMLKLSRGLESFTPINEPKDVNTTTNADVEPPTLNRKNDINNFEPSLSTMDFHINNSNNNSNKKNTLHKHTMAGMK